MKRDSPRQGKSNIRSEVLKISAGGDQSAWWSVDRELNSSVRFEPSPHPPAPLTPDPHGEERRLEKRGRVNPPYEFPGDVSGVESVERS